MMLIGGCWTGQENVLAADVFLIFTKVSPSGKA
jgi:hypothetical protein